MTMFSLRRRCAMVIRTDRLHAEVRATLMTDERKTGRIVPVILAGGSGTRLWPLSRSLCPKQFLPLLTTDSLLVETCRRVSDTSRFAPPIVICSSHHQSLLTQQLRDADVHPE